MSTEAAGSVTTQQSQITHRVEIEIKEHPAEHAEEHGDFLALSGRPFDAGKRTDEGSHNIMVRNFTGDQVRVCFISRDGTPIADYFVNPINVGADETVGWVQLEAPTGGAPSRQYKIELADSAFDTTGGVIKKRHLGVSGTKLSLSRPCTFPDDDHTHPDDIVFEAGP